MEDRKWKEAEFHDHRLKEYPDNDYPNRKFYSITQSSTDFLWNLLKVRCKGKRVLDYCCGKGETTIKIAELGADTFGIDISTSSIERAISEAGKRGLDKLIKFAVMDAEATGFADSTFDYILVSGALHHLDIEKAYKELARILKPDGAIICVEGLAHNPLINLYRKLTPNIRTHWEAEHILRKEGIELAKNHFGKIETNFFHLAAIMAIPFRNIKGLFNFLMLVLSSIDSVLLRLPLIKWQAWIVIFILSKP